MSITLYPVTENIVAEVYGADLNQPVELLAHASQPQFVHTHRWRERDLVMWDNRCTMHYAVGDYLPNYRCMHRITVIRDQRAAAKSQAT